jgi:uncharacterized SAM-binding protein YcdF (DUF218 family)
MDMSIRLMEALITPPGIVVLLLLLTFFGYLRKYWLGTGLLAFSMLVLLALSLPRTGHWLLADLQHFSNPPALVPMAERGPQATLFVPKDSLKSPPQAIVVLGARRYTEAPEYDYQDTVGPLGLERLRYAVFLQRKTGVPILVSGGAPGGERTSEAELMKAVLTDEFRTSVKWVEDRSRSTLENASYSQELLAAAKIRHVYLVTHAWHMRRAARAFESLGIQVTPAPTGYQTLTRVERDQSSYLPSAWGMHLTSLALRERLAFYWSGFEDEAVPAAGKPAAATSAK